MKRKILSIIYILSGIILLFIFYRDISFSITPDFYFNSEFYRQFGRVVLPVELTIAGLHLLIKHRKTNFAMGLFGFTAVLDPIFNYTGLFSTNIPIYGSIIFLCFAAISFKIVFSNAFETAKISMINLLVSFILGVIIELFFNYYLY